MTGCDVATPYMYFDPDLRTFDDGSGSSTARTVTIKPVTTSYPIYIYGRQLNDVNVPNFRVKGMASNATAKYGHSYKELSLKDTFTNTTAGLAGIKSSGQDLKILLTGACYIQAAGNGLELTGANSYEVEGETFNISSTGGNAINMGQASGSLLLDCYNFGVVGSSYGLYGGSAKVTMRYKDDCEYRFKGNSACIYAGGGIDYLCGNDQSIGIGLTSKSDTGYYIYNGSVYYKNASSTTDNLAKGDYIYFRACTIYYNLKVAGTKVNSQNAAFFTSHNITGKIYYTPDSNTLTLSNATITVEDNAYHCINNSVNDLNINIQGNNTLTTTRICILTNKPTTIKGTGTLNLNGDHGLYPDGTLLTIDGSPTININAPVGFYGEHTGKVIVKGAPKITVNASSYVSGFLKEFTLGGGLYYTEPYGLKFDSSLQGHTLDGSRLYKGKMLISTTPPTNPVTNYGLFMGGTEVTSANASNPLSNGAFNYNASTKTLTVKGDYSHSSSIVKNTGVDGLTILFNGERTLKCTGATVMELLKSTTIKGNGNTVNIVGYGSGHSGIYHHADDETSQTLTIENIDLKMSNVRYGLVSALAKETTKRTHLVLGGNGTTTIDINTTGGECLADFKSVTMKGDMHVAEPAGTQLKDGSICDASGNYINGHLLLTDEESAVKQGDVNGDGTVDVADIATVISIMAANARRLRIED